ncbi:MAG: FAD-dependent monooxygenase [Balneolaceae bacterium]|nr:MAG: FAD-dependent monooxygenase [Balneolaceae bacterium]
MTPNTENVDVLICGAGPVGLYLGCALAETDLSFCILETNPAPLPHSRSIGIHPPSVGLFDKIGLGDQLISRGVRISKGVAHHDHGVLGTLDFNLLPPPHRYVLAVPQFETETLLEARVEHRRRGSVRRGMRLTDFHTDGKMVHAYASGENGDQHAFESKFLVGCDGKNSLVRELAGIGFHGKSYPDTYVMGDFPEHNAEKDRDTAHIHLHSHGLVESFPLPGGMRRWVIKTDSFAEKDPVDVLCRLASDRTGVTLKPETRTMISAFGVQRYLASAMVSRNIILAGDSGHIVSPIGGQGMNLGWMDAAELADLLPQIVRGNLPVPELRQYSRNRLKAARTAIRRAEFNMTMGRNTRVPAIRNAFAKLMLKRPFNKLMAGLFTMRWL